MWADCINKRLKIWIKSPVENQDKNNITILHLSYKPQAFIHSPDFKKVHKHPLNESEENKKLEKNAYI
jgi:hypothetical protein